MFSQKAKLVEALKSSLSTPSPPQRFGLTSAFIKVELASFDSDNYWRNKDEL